MSTKSLFLFSGFEKGKDKNEPERQNRDWGRLKLLSRLATHCKQIHPYAVIVFCTFAVFMYLEITAYGTHMLVSAEDRMLGCKFRVGCIFAA